MKSRQERPLTAYEWGLKNNSCSEAMEWRKGLGPRATQRDAWKRCHRSEWMIWQLGRLPIEIQIELKPPLTRVFNKIVARSVRKHARHCPAESVRAWAKGWLSWADRTEKSAIAARDTSRAAASAAAYAAASAAAAAYAAASAARFAAGATTWYIPIEAAIEVALNAAWGVASDPRVATGAAAWNAARNAESKRQARDIRYEIPEWPGEV